MNQHNVNGTNVSRSLPQCWRRWMEIVEMYALHHHVRGRVDPRYYENLHRELRSACFAPTVNEADQRYYATIEIFVRPWLSLNVLEDTDHEILCSVLERSRQIDRELNGADRFHHVRQWGGRLLAVGVVAALAAALAMLGMEKLLRDGFNAAYDFVTKLASGVTWIQGTIAVGVAAAIISFCLVSRTTRT